MARVIPFRRRLNAPMALWAIAALVIAFAATMAYLNWQSSRSIIEQGVGGAPNSSGHIYVIDGDTVRYQGMKYRLSGIDAPEVGDKARCEDERRRADAATARLRALIAGGDARLIRVSCSCRPGQEGTRFCNYGRLCGSILIGGRDVGAILISEGLAQPYVCSAVSCPPRRPWCGR
jgi:endonuclease YncB( thermonuclease family)